MPFYKFTADKRLIRQPKLLNYWRYKYFNCNIQIEMYATLMACTKSDVKKNDIKPDIF